MKRLVFLLAISLIISLSAAVVWADPPPNDDCANADDGGLLQPGIPMQFTGTISEATQDCMLSYFPDVWIKFSTEVCLNITIDFCGTDPAFPMMPGMNLFDTCPCGTPFNAASTNFCEGEFNQTATWYGIQPGTYYFAIAGYGDPSYIVNVNGIECPPPPEVDEYITAPATVIGNTCGAINNCQDLLGEDYIYQVTIPSDGQWKFSLCGSNEVWNSAMSLGASLCGNEYVLDYDGCGVTEGQAQFLADLVAGDHYLLIDGEQPLDCGEYTLEISPFVSPCEGSYISNGEPNLEWAISDYRNGESYEYFAADDFTLTETATIDSIRISCYTASLFDFAGLGDYQILADDGTDGAPGTVLFEDTDVSCSRYTTGQTMWGSLVYVYQFNNLGIDLPAGHYFLACRPVAAEFNFDENNWLATDMQTGAMAYYKNTDNPEWAISELNTDLAFCLFGTTSGGNTYEYLPGDANMYAGGWPPSTIGGDVTYLVSYFRGITTPCMLDGFYASADANGSCTVTGADVTKLVSYFRGMDVLSYCPDYPTTWPPIPDTAPDGWPNCSSPVLSK